MDTLIDPNTREWVAEMVDGLFILEDAEIIKKIPLGKSTSEDTMYWPLSSNGLYSYKSH